MTKENCHFHKFFEISKFLSKYVQMLGNIKVKLSHENNIFEEMKPYFQNFNLSGNRGWGKINRHFHQVFEISKFVYYFVTQITHFAIDI